MPTEFEPEVVTAVVAVEGAELDAAVELAATVELAAVVDVPTDGVTPDVAETGEAEASDAW